jgi:acyl transferase domain-containing protein/thioesterase domain-containing protein
MISNLAGAFADERELRSAEYWVRQLRETVRFGAGLAAAMQEPGTVLIEVGPGRTLSALAEVCEGAHTPRAIVHCMRQVDDAGDDVTSALEAAGRLWMHGVPVECGALRGDTRAHRISLPSYAFARNRHWIAPGIDSFQAATPQQTLARRSASVKDEWISVRKLVPKRVQQGSPALQPQWLVFAEDTHICNLLVAKLAAQGARVIRVLRGRSFTELDGSAYTLDPEAAGDFVRLIEAVDSRGGAPSAILYAWPLGAPPLGRARALCFDALMYLIRALQLHDTNEERQLRILTSGAIAAPGEKAAQPERCLSLGVCVVAPHETPGVSTQLIDIDAGAPADQMMSAVLDELGQPPADDVVALRSRERFVEAIQASTSASSETRVKLREGGVYLITGGLGGIGLVLAEFLARETRARLALITRTLPKGENTELELGYGPPEDVERARAIGALKAAGAEVLVLEADVADKRQMRRALDRIRKTFGEVHGVFHAAGRIDDRPIALKEYDEASAVLDPKFAGGFVMDELCPDGALDFFVAFSSTSVSLGPPGQADYVAANAVLEAIVGRRKDGLCVRWGAWSDLGMATRAVDGVAKISFEPVRHPLLGAVAASGDGASQSYWASLDVAANWVLAEHRIAGRPVLPGAAYIEMALAAAARSGFGETATLGDAAFVAPLALYRPGPQRVRVSILPRGDGETRVEIESRSTGGAWTLHFEATLTTGDAIERLHAPIELPVDVAAERLVMDDRGIAFGPRWRCLRRVSIGESWARGELALDATYDHELSIFSAHPAMLDVASSIGLFLIDDVGEGHGVYAPVSVEQIQSYAPLPQAFVSTARLRNAEPGRSAVFDVDLCDEAGTRLMALRGVAFRRIDAGALAQKRDDHAADRNPLAQLLANGIRSEDAPAVFKKVFASTEPAIVCSPVSIEQLRSLYAAPQTPAATSRQATTESDDIEGQVRRMCADVLGLDEIEPDAEFLSYGGGSLAGVRLFARIRRELGVKLALSDLLQASTPRLLAALIRENEPLSATRAIDRTGVSAKSSWSPLVLMRPGDKRIPALYLVHGAGGNILVFKAIVDRLPSGGPIYGLKAQGIDGDLPFHETVEEMAQCYLEAIRKQESSGQYQFVGYSGGGVIAFEMAQRMRQMGQNAGLVCMIDTLAPHCVGAPISTREKILMLPRVSPRYLLHLPLRNYRRYMAIRRVADAMSGKDPDAVPELELLGGKAWDAFWQAQLKYKPQPFDGDILLFRAMHASLRFVSAGPTLGWSDVVSGKIDVVDIDAWHDTVFEPPAIDLLVQVLARRLAGSRTPISSSLLAADG